MRPITRKFLSITTGNFNGGVVMEINGKVHCFFEQEEWRDINGFEGLYQVSNKKYCYEFTEHRQ